MRFIALILVSALGLALPACGEGHKGLEGSKCDIISCGYDRIDCQFYRTPDDAAVIHYKRVLEEGERWTAKIIVELDGIDLDTLKGGRLFEGEEFLNRVYLQRPNELEQWGDFDGNRCELKLGAPEDGANLSGKCSFSFLDGMFLTARFDCSVELIEVD